MESPASFYQRISRKDRDASKRTIRAALIDGRRPLASRLRWPSRPVVFEMFAWLNSHPHVEEWCRGSHDHCDEFVSFLASVESCYARKKKGSARLDIDSKGVVRDGTSPLVESQESNIDSGSATTIPVRWWPTLGVMRSWPRRSDRELARDCFNQRGKTIVERLLRLREVASLIEELGFKGGGWYLSAAEDHAEDLARVLELAKKLNQNKMLQRILEELGRIDKRLEAESTCRTAQMFESIFDRQRVRRVVLQPGVPFETRGIELSDDIELMLPDEAVLLAAPDWEDLWFVRYSESQLANYSVAGTDIEERIERRPRRKPKPVSRTGPVIALIDTSASMQWGESGMDVPEVIAKAAVLGLCRVAFKQQRRVFIINFSGSTNLAQHELTFDIKGLLKLLNFLEKSFGGGTDINSPMKMALQKVGAEEDWERADILIASDGAFAVQPEVIALSDNVKLNTGLRITGLLIGSQSASMDRLCGRRVHPFRSWQSVSSPGV